LDFDSFATEVAQPLKKNGLTRSATPDSVVWVN
jgi:hypothetical protein